MLSNKQLSLKERRKKVSSHTILLEDGRWVDEDSWKSCNCILCQDDGAVIEVEQDYCIEGSKLDKPIGEKQ